MQRCNAPTLANTPCRWPENECPIRTHANWRKALKRHQKSGYRPRLFIVPRADPRPEWYHEAMSQVRRKRASR